MKVYEVILGAGLKDGLVEICRREKNVLIKFLRPRASERGGNYSLGPFTVGTSGI